MRLYQFAGHPNILEKARKTMEKSELSDYEQLREQNIERNTSFLREIGIYDTSQKTKETSVVVAKKRRFVEPERRSHQHQQQKSRSNQAEHVNIAEFAHSLKIIRLGAEWIGYSWNGSYIYTRSFYMSAEVIDNALIAMPKLHTLDISDFKLGPEAVPLLANVLSKMPNLKTLNISGNAIGSDGASHLVHVLARVPKLQNLDISRNEIGPEGAHRLTQSFDRVPLLRQLWIGHNKLGGGGITMLSALCMRDEIRWKSMLAARCLSCILPCLVVDLLLSYLPQGMELVRMEGNRMTGKIEGFIRSFYCLQNISLRGNHLESIDRCLFSLPNLKSFEVYN